LAGDPAHWPVKAVGYEEAAEKRRFETRDIAVRLGAVSPDRLFLNGFPARNPIAAFNPSILLDEEEGEVQAYIRILVGYYKYVSAVAEARIPLSDLESGSVSMNYYSANIVLPPGSRYDLWGVEDPRAYTLNGLRLVTYTGRTVGYFNREGKERTLPVTAVETNRGWRRALVHRATPSLSRSVVSNKDAFIIDTGDALWLAHRPSLTDGSNPVLLSLLPRNLVLDVLEGAARGVDGRLPVEVHTRADWEVMRPISCESKIGWSAPPIHLGGRDYLFLLHGVGKPMAAYRVFAAIVELNREEGPIVKAVTPYYIMGPREQYETFGDRPYTVFPCGLAERDGRLLISYGAADYMAAFALIGKDRLLSALDEGRIF